MSLSSVRVQLTLLNIAVLALFAALVFGFAKPDGQGVGDVGDYVGEELGLGEGLGLHAGRRSG